MFEHDKERNRLQQARSLKGLLKYKHFDQYVYNCIEYKSARTRQEVWDAVDSAISDLRHMTKKNYLNCSEGYLKEQEEKLADAKKKWSDD